MVRARKSEARGGSAPPHRRPLSRRQDRRAPARASRRQAPAAQRRSPTRVCDAASSRLLRHDENVRREIARAERSNDQFVAGAQEICGYKEVVVPRLIEAELEIDDLQSALRENRAERR